MKLDKALKTNAVDEAKKLQADIDVLRDVLKLGTVPSIMKRSVELAKIAEVGPARKPVREVNQKVDEKIKEMLSYYKL
ncbi:hypothetical protein D3C81_1687660 [compost metagenome]